jgi:type IV pilus assembly protein PilO
MTVELKLLAGIVLAGVLFAGYEFYDFYSTDLPAMEAKRQAAETELTNRQNELRRLQEFAQNIEVIKQELRELNLQLESALEHMPRTFNFSGLLRKLTMLAQNSGLELSSFKPADHEDKVPGAFYSVIGLEFELHGTFTQTLVFFDQVSRLKRIINIDTVSMNVKRDDSTRNNSTRLDTKVAVRTYRFAE